MPCQGIDEGFSLQSAVIKSFWLILPCMPFVGLSLVIAGGAVVFLCLLTTAVIGYLIMAGKADIPLVWHQRMAGITVAIAIIHASLGLAFWLGV